MSKVAKLYDPKFRNCGEIQDTVYYVALQTVQSMS